MNCGDAAWAESTQELLRSKCSRNTSSCGCRVGECWLCSLSACWPFYDDLPCSYQKLWLLLEPQVGPGDRTQWSALAFQSTASRDQTQVVKVCSKHLYPLSHLASLSPCFRCEYSIGANSLLIHLPFLCRPSSLAALSLPA